MEPNIQYLIIGSGITLLASLVVTIVANILQSGREEKSRLWQIEDNNNKEEIISRKKRLDKIEEYVTALSHIASSLFDAEITTLDILKTVMEKDQNIKYFKMYQEYNSKSKTANSSKKDKFNSKNFHAFANRIIKFATERVVQIVNLQDQFYLSLKDDYHVSALGNDEIKDKVDEYWESIRLEISSGLDCLSRILNGKIQNIKSIKKEETRLYMFLTTTNKLHGEILKELDNQLLI